MKRLVESGINKKMNILIISSGMPTDNSPKQALDMLKALGEDHHADLLLKYPLKKIIIISFLFMGCGNNISIHQLLTGKLRYIH